MYNVRREKYKSVSEDNINFRVSPTPFKLNKTQRNELKNIGEAICGYMDCCIELYKTNEHVHNILDRNKPNNFKDVQDVKYLFLRPDLILTDFGFCVCEIETSPFGLGLAEVLNRTYGNEGYETIVHENQLKNYIQSQVPKNGIIAYSKKVKAFSGQLDFMAEQLFSYNKKSWRTIQVGGSDKQDKPIYRAFYLNEQLTDKAIANLLKEGNIYLPTSTPQFEEKALLSFIWDKRYSTFIHENLGSSTYNLLRNIIPKTWILGEEKYVDCGLPYGKQSSIELAEVGKSNRKFVLKQSGFSSSSSWGEGVKFLHKMSGKSALETLKTASEYEKNLYVIQEFRGGKAMPMPFIEEDGVIRNINAKIRITPYYAYIGQDKGKLIAAKVTGCENTEYIHASTASINTAISYERD